MAGRQLSPAGNNIFHSSKSQIRNGGQHLNVARLAGCALGSGNGGGVRKAQGTISLLCDLYGKQAMTLDSPGT